MTRFWIAAFFLAAFIAAALVQLQRPGLNRIFLDETAHASFIVHLQKTGAWWPRYDDLPMIDKDTLKITDWRQNYLNHPPFYYKLMALLGPQLEARPDNIIFFRLFNLALVASGLLLLYRFAFNLQLAPLPFAAFAALVTFVPLLPLLSVTINNDNLGFCAGALTLFAAERFITKRKTSACLLMLAGVILAAMAKLTAFMLTGGFAAALLAVMAWHRMLKPAQLALSLAALVLAALPYLLLTVQYGNPVPQTDGYLALIKDSAAQLGWADKPRLGPITYMISFVYLLGRYWSDLLAQDFAGQFTSYLALLFIAFISCAFLKNIYGALRKEKDKGIFLIGAGGLALGITLAAHVASAYAKHVKYGDIIIAYPRYYLPALGLMAFALLSLAQSIPNAKARTVFNCALLVGPAILTLLSVPRFLLLDVSQ